ncbi:MAG TPA: hypothetical protein VMZ49_01715 [Patescibacteria group bacterium]|nr:hypothetical protein [Patescibacteria group bacterium]
MTRKTGMVLLAMLLALSFCSKNKEVAPVESNRQTEPSQVGRSASGETPLQVKTVSLIPENPTVLDDVTAVPVLSDTELEKVGFQYQWYVNGQENREIDGETLEKSYYKKGAWLYCRIKAVYGNEESAWRKSDIIRVHNSLPVFNLAPVGPFSIPGDFQYQVAASDADGDELTYEVLAPLDQGIEIDPLTGILTWKIDAETVKRLEQIIEIKLAVSDGEGEKTSGSVTLNLTKPQ